MQIQTEKMKGGSAKTSFTQPLGLFFMPRDAVAAVNTMRDLHETLEWEVLSKVVFWQVRVRWRILLKGQIHNSAAQRWA
jgi:hypothetical protein